MTSKPKGELLRLVAADRLPRADITGRSNGRGVYLCRDTECLDKALKRNALTRGLSLEALTAEGKERVRAELGEFIPGAEVCV
jgi:predicted RNA-binding protein YlxR (DUF448 family)